MGVFTHLPDHALTAIAAQLTQDWSLQGNTLDLLPLRLVHPCFIEAITFCIFRHCRVIMYKPISRDRHTWIPSARYLHHMDNPKFHRAVRYLQISAKSGNVFYGEGSSSRVGWEHFLSVLTAVSDNIRTLILCDETVRWPHVAMPTCTSIFHRLQNLTIDTWWLPFLPTMLQHAPVLQSLKIEGYSWWAYLCMRIWPLFGSACNDYQAYRTLQHLDIGNADDDQQHRLIESLRICAKHISISITVWKPNGLLALAKGLLEWPIFQGVELITIRCDNSNHRRLSIVKPALKQLNVEVRWENDTKDTIDLAQGQAEGH